MAFQSKNSRVGRKTEDEDINVLGRYNPGNVGAAWKTGRRKGGSCKLDFRLRRKIAKHTYIRIG